MLSLRYVILQQGFHELIFKTKQVEVCQKRGAVCYHWYTNASTKDYLDIDVIYWIIYLAETWRY